MFGQNRTGLPTALVLVLISASTAWGFAVDVLYAISGRGSSTLYILDDLGRATAVGPMGANITDIAFYRGTFYGITSSKFYQIDPDTGAASLVGLLHAGSLNALAVNPATGQAYAAGADGVFIRIDPATAAGTRIGSLGIADGGRITAVGDLVFDPQGIRLYASVDWGPHGNSDYLATIDPSTGVATIIGDIGYDKVYGLAFKDGGLYGVTGDEEFLRLDPLTGRGTEINHTGIRYYGMTAAPVPSPVPVPNAVWLFGSGFVCLAGWGRQRRSRRRPGLVRSAPNCVSSHFDL